jgi:hypothetical protein
MTGWICAGIDNQNPWQDPQQCTSVGLDTEYFLGCFNFALD